MALVFRCPVCGEKNYTKRKIGEAIKCDSCSNKITIPITANTLDIEKEKSINLSPHNEEREVMENFINKCPQCGTKYREEVRICTACGYNFPFDSENSNIQSQNKTLVPDSMGEKSIRALRFVSWLYLILSIIGAIIIGVSLGTKTVPSYWETTKDVMDPYWIGASIGLVIQAILIFSFLHVVCAIAENIIEIRRKIEEGFCV